MKIEASFSADTIVIRSDKTDFYIINLNPDWTWSKYIIFSINDTSSIESITLSSSKLYVKSNESYYE